MSPLREELSIILKDGLRGARYMLRRGVRFGMEPNRLSSAVPQLARLAGSVATATEKAASFLSHDSVPITSERFSQSISDVLTTKSRAEARAIFVENIYRLSEQVLVRLDVENAFISSVEISLAFSLLWSDHREAQRATRQKPLFTRLSLTRFWVFTLVHLNRRSPIREIDAPALEPSAKREYLETNAEAYCLLIVTLAAATITARYLAADGQFSEGSSAELDHSIDSAIAVITARFKTFSTHLDQPNAIDLLCIDFETVLPFLP
ncbi:hypothetical protein ACELLULO517_14125 [Acidisoma cellulosilytica]|uniref:Uncharacterized protein n=1 Tax=Acidisoma cellulosilyticum TaxID=2802395 RepID=A0A963Z3S2_9PROT|nr:hypothetical protein [Acidisoma cellulosilyticum]MCB8881382.1 hypothetical protein [Acidisoma cellulosilyticum]